MGFITYKRLWKWGFIIVLSIITVAVLQKHLSMDCDLEMLNYDILTIKFQCKQYVHATLELPPTSKINCSRIIRGDSDAIKEAKESQSKRRLPLTEDHYMEITRDCKTFKKDRKYFTFSLSKEEEEFPLAYTMVIHNKIEMFERLLRSIYMPHNVYCVHIDEKSKAKFKEAVKSITMCFDNVFVASKLETVVYASWSRVQADLNCMEDLLESTVQWKYLLNTCGTDFPIKTNHEIVIALKSLNGKNSMESEKTPAYKMGRWLYHHDVDKRVLRTTEKKSAPPDNIPMFSGNAYVVITKDFVKTLFNNLKVKKILEWEKDTFSPDEHLWATLHRMPEVPGSVPSHSKYDTSDLQAIARLVKWLGAAGDLSKGAPYENCNGIFARGICVYGIGDLPWMLQQHHLFANKFDTLVDNYAIECLEQYVRHKTLYGTNL